MNGDVHASSGQGLTLLKPSALDRATGATIVGLLIFLLLRKSPNRVAWMALGAALGAFVLPRFVSALREPGDDGRIVWALMNPFAGGGPQPVYFLTGR